MLCGFWVLCVVLFLVCDCFGGFGCLYFALRLLIIIEIVYCLFRMGLCYEVLFAFGVCVCLIGYVWLGLYAGSLFVFMCFLLFVWVVICVLDLGLGVNDLLAYLDFVAFSVLLMLLCCLCLIVIDFDCALLGCLLVVDVLGVWVNTRRRFAVFWVFLLICVWMCGYWLVLLLFWC